MYCASSSLFNIYAFKASDGNDSFNFETSRIKNKKNKLLVGVDYEKLLQQEFEDIYKTLNDLEYNIGLYDSEESILNKMDESFKREFKALAKSLASYKLTGKLDESPLYKYLFVPFDFFNMKVIFKGLINEISFENLEFSTLGLFSKESLLKVYNGKEVPFGSKVVQKYVKKYRLNAKPTSSMELDLIWDKYLFEFYADVVKELKSDFAFRFLLLQIDVRNVLTFFRLKTLEKDLPDFKNLFIKGGNILFTTLSPLFKEEMDMIVNAFSYVPFYDALKKGLEYYKENTSFSELEKELEQFTLHILKQACNRVQGQELLIAYFWLKKNELSNLKILLSAKANAINNNWALSKIREVH